MKTSFAPTVILLAALLLSGVSTAKGQPLHPKAVFSFTNSLSNPRASLVEGLDGCFYGPAENGHVFKVTTNGVLSQLANVGNWIECLTLGPDGQLYGTAPYGATGSVFRLTTNGELTTLANFTASQGRPRSLTLGRDGNFYGTTSDGGSKELGTIFRLTPGGTLSTLAEFKGTNGSSPNGPLAFGEDGTIYGTTELGGSGKQGTVFRLTTNGLLTKLVEFTGANGGIPQAGLTLGGDGHFYGTTSQRWGPGEGTVFRITPAGELTTLVQFNITNGSTPMAKLALGNDGNLYGTTSGSDTGSGYVAFRISTNGAFTVMVNFTNVGGPYGLTLGSDGYLYGTTYAGGSAGDGSVYRLSTNGEFVVLASFILKDGRSPAAKLTLDNDGAFYGTTTRGGTNGHGTAFRLTTNGVLTTLASFDGNNGSFPFGSLTFGNDENLYGTTFLGGYDDGGTVFRLTRDGSLSKIADLNSPISGASPGLTLGSDGKFYGATYNNLFSLTTNGVVTSLYEFQVLYEPLTSSIGSNVEGELVFGGDGHIYGETIYGGAGGFGTIFKMTTAGTLTTLFAFNGTNGAIPKGGLTKGKDGNFYGITTEDSHFMPATVFKLTPRGSITHLAKFTGTNGSFRSESSVYSRLPIGKLIRGPDGTLYGTTTSGGRDFGQNIETGYSWGRGIIFKIADDKMTILADLTKETGHYPRGELAFGPEGSLYGSTFYGGYGGAGTIFRLDLPPTITSPPASRFNGAGTTATFAVATVGTSPFSYQWLKNGTNLMDSGNISGANSGTLTLADVQPGDAGNFSLIVTNIAGSVTSSVAALTVLTGSESAVASLQVGVAGPNTNTLTFAGVPNTEYVVQFATNLTGSPWFTLTTNTASAEGTWLVIDPMATNAQRFYRAVAP